MKPVNNSNSAFYHLKMAAKLAVINTWAFCKRVVTLLIPPQLRPYQKNRDSGFLDLKNRRVGVKPDLSQFNTDALYERLWPNFNAVLIDFVKDSKAQDKDYGGQFKLNGARVVMSIQPKLQKIFTLDDLISLVDKKISGSSKTYLLLKLNQLISEQGDNDFLSAKSKTILENANHHFEINLKAIPAVPENFREVGDIKAALLSYMAQYYQSLKGIPLEKVYLSNLYAAMSSCNDLNQIKELLTGWDMPSVQTHLQGVLREIELQRKENIPPEIEHNIKQSLYFLMDEFIRIEASSHRETDKPDATKRQRRDSTDSALGDELPDTENESNASPDNIENHPFIDEGFNEVFSDKQSSYESDRYDLSERQVSLPMLSLQLSLLKTKLNELSFFTKENVEQVIRRSAPEQIKEVLLTSLYEDFERYEDLFEGDQNN